MITASVVGASGYVGGELVRLLLSHPEVELRQVTSDSYVGKFLHAVHPNLRKQSVLRFSPHASVEECDVLFSCLPHGKGMERISEFIDRGKRIIDLSADFRLRNPGDYVRWYGREHPAPGMLKEFVYGIPELHREEMRRARLVSSAGCLATCAILSLYPLFREDLVLPEVVVDAKVGSSAAGASPSPSTHHPVRRRAVRSIAPTGHRHTAEIIQELSFHGLPAVTFTPHAVELVRGILTTSYVTLRDDLDEKDLWRAYRKAFSEEPFMRIVKESSGVYRYPEPKILAGTNFCDVGFEKDSSSRRVVVLGAIDNLMKGAAGQAVQAMNIMHGFDETAGLGFPGLHPV